MSSHVLWDSSNKDKENPQAGFEVRSHTASFQHGHCIFSQMEGYVFRKTLD